MAKGQELDIYTTLEDAKVEIQMDNNYI